MDDEAPVRSVIAALLEGQGYVVETAVDGLDALHKLQRGVFGVVVTDQHMPRLNGLALAGACKTLAQPVPVVLITGSDMPTAQELHDCGIQEALAKPFTIIALLEAVDRAQRR